VRTLRDAGIGVSLFIDPEEDAAKVSADLGAIQAELHTGDYCHARPGSALAVRELDRLRRAGAAVVSAGLQLAAGHGLDYGNVGPVAAIAHLEELNIGHSMIAQAVMVGMERAVKDMRAAIEAGVGRRAA
jgi:pyridoxine 5-phosphate synthase